MSPRRFGLSPREYDANRSTVGKCWALTRFAASRATWTSRYACRYAGLSCGAYSPDGNFLAYEPLSQWQPDWKHYHGGQQDVVWIARLSDSSIEKVPHADGQDRYPMWIGETMYFVSDRANGIANLFAQKSKGSTHGCPLESAPWLTPH